MLAEEHWIIAARELRVPRQRKLTDIGCVSEKITSAESKSVEYPSLSPSSRGQGIKEESLPLNRPPSIPVSFLSGIHSASIDAGY